MKLRTAVAAKRNIPPLQWN